MRVLLASALTLGLALAAAAADDPITAAVKPKLKDPSKPFTMAVVLKVKEARAKEFEAAFAEAAKGTRTEKGHVVYNLYRDADRDGAYVAIEKWKSLDALREHVAAAHTKKLLAALPDMLDGAPEIKVLVPVE